MARRPAEPVSRALALIAAAGVPLDLPAPTRDPRAVHRAVDEVLARPEFRQAGGPPLERAWELALRFLGRLLATLTTTTAGSIIGVVLFLVILALLAMIGVRFARGMSASPEVAAAIRARPWRGAAEWRAEAAAREAAGEWRQAVRCRYRALVADLASRGVVDEFPGRTSGEYRGEVGRNLPTASAQFADATEVFERAWYGRRPTGEGDAARFRDLAGRVLERAPA